MFGLFVGAAWLCNQVSGPWCALCPVAWVGDFESLCELVVLEQFKNSIPQRIATYLSEQKATTVLKAAELADDFVLTHQSSLGDAQRRASSYGNSRYSAQLPTSGPSQAFKASRGRYEGGRVCNYCQGAGHWKDQCPVLRSKSKYESFSPALACSVVPRLNPVSADPGSSNGFEPFIADAVVFLVGSKERVPIKILRDTGAKHSFIVESVLPFSSKTETGDFILMRGMGLELTPVPRHNMVLECDLVRGAVAVGVRPALPIEGVAMIVGNDLAGGVVWADGLPPPVVTSKPLASMELDESGQRYPEVFPACAVTRAQSRVLAAPDLSSPVRKPESVVSIPDLPPSFLEMSGLKARVLIHLCPGWLLVSLQGLNWKMLRTDTLYRMSCL